MRSGAWPLSVSIKLTKADANMTGNNDHPKSGQRLLVLVLAAIVWSMASPALADIYMYIDSMGVLHFTNTPTSSDYKLYIKERPKPRPPPHTTKKFDPFIREASDKHGIEFYLLKALIKVESDFNPTAVSRSGALGLMQIMPDNVEAFNIKDPFDPWQNIMGGAGYLRQLLQRFDGKLPLALAAYNAGPTVVEQFRRVPPFKETEEYVKKVMTYYNAYKNS